MEGDAVQHISSTVMQVSSMHRIREFEMSNSNVRKDSCVGVEQGDEVVGAMVGCGIEVTYERPHGEDHFLDGAPEYENEAFYSFLLKHV